MKEKTTDNEILFQEITKLTHELELKSAIVERLQNEKDILTKKFSTLSNELYEERNLRAKYVELYMNIANSTFWRLTKPLRTFCDCIKGMK